MSNKRHEAQSGVRIAGRQTYEGGECIHGHGRTRYVSNNNCVACTRTWNQAHERRRRKKIEGVMAAVESSDMATAGGDLGSLDPQARLLAIYTRSAAEYRRRAYHEAMQAMTGQPGRPRRAARAARASRSTPGLPDTGSLPKVNRRVPQAAKRSHGRGMVG